MYYLMYDSTQWVFNEMFIKQIILHTYNTHYNIIYHNLRLFNLCNYNKQLLFPKMCSFICINMETACMFMKIINKI